MLIRQVRTGTFPPGLSVRHMIWDRRGRLMTLRRTVDWEVLPFTPLPLFLKCKLFCGRLSMVVAVQLEEEPGLCRECPVRYNTRTPGVTHSIWKEKHWSHWGSTGRSGVLRMSGVREWVHADDGWVHVSGRHAGHVHRARSVVGKL